jgi:uncharacterized ferredoxin-like protein
MSTLEIVADLMALAARTAPKSAGQDFVELKIITGAQITETAAEMERYGQDTGKKNFDRDARGVAASKAVLLVGIKDAKPVGLNCGACGYDRCSELQPGEGPEFKGGTCAFRLLDMGIALGSAVRTAGLLCADTRIMYRIGVAARRLGLIDADYVMGIPLSATGKNIYFDRG